MTVQPSSAAPVLHASRAGHRAAVENAPIALRITHEIVVETVIDLVGYFASLAENERATYHRMDIAAAGFAEYERPLVYLARTLEPEVIEPLIGSAYAVSRVDDHDYTDRVTARDGEITFGADGDWSRDDYARLLEAVAWMRPVPTETPEAVADAPLS